MRYIKSIIIIGFLLFWGAISFAQKKTADPFSEKVKPQKKKKRKDPFGTKYKSQTSTIIASSFTSKVVQKKSETKKDSFAKKQKKSKKIKGDGTIDPFSKKYAPKEHSLITSSFSTKTKPSKKKKDEERLTSAFSYKVKPKKREASSVDAFSIKVKQSKGFSFSSRKPKSWEDGTNSAFSSSYKAYKKPKQKTKKGVLIINDGTKDHFSSEKKVSGITMEADAFTGGRKRRAKKHFKGEKPKMFTKGVKGERKKKDKKPNEDSFTISHKAKKTDSKERRSKSSELDLFQKKVQPK